MDTDLALTVGIVLAVLSVPSLLSAWVDGRAPRLGAIMAIAAFAQAHRDRLVELDVNPLLVGRQGLGATAVDAVVRFQG